ncbi:MAG: hypothetical protein EBR94_00810 [Bacteroidetes bacterium]|nr:hypothetical protein [Bacteroidota bacterium]
MSKFSNGLENNDPMKLELDALKKRNNISAREIQKLNEQVDRLTKTIESSEQILSQNLQPPTWLAPAKPKKSSATLVVMLSDTHFDEVVVPEEVDFLNAYNRTIATMRLQKWTENVIKVSRHYLSGVTYDGVFLILGGDIFSGDIHEELHDTNASTMLDSLLYWSEQLTASISLLAEEFGKVHITSVVGNHGRTTRKPRMKLRVKTNYDWLVTKMIERYFEKDNRVTFQIPEGADSLVSIYGYGQLITHGDQASGGGGIGGIWPPIMRLRARKAQRYLATESNFQTMWCGHWHQLVQTPSLIINGSLKGVDEYAFINNFSFEQPQQALAVITPERGITIQAPIFCADRKAEGW